ncbi:MAG: hypothetical protein AABZ60_20780 [Planctomycetota bacterium]
MLNFIQRLSVVLVFTAFLLAGCNSTASKNDPMALSSVDSLHSENSAVIEEAIQNLLSSDFFAHSEGAAVLVRHGKESLPLLANTLHIERSVYHEQVPAVKPVLATIFQTMTPTEVANYLNHSHPLLRATALFRIGESGQVALLKTVTLLTQDPVLEVQQEALVTLEKLEALKTQTAYLIK